MCRHDLPSPSLTSPPTLRLVMDESQAAVAAEIAADDFFRDLPSDDARAAAIARTSFICGWLAGYEHNEKG